MPSKCGHVQLGNSGLRVSRLISSLNFHPPRIEPDQVRFLLDLTYARGIDTWDLGNVHMESLVGTWLKNNSTRREKIILMAKVGLGTDLHAPLSRANLLNQTRDILERVGTYIDILQITRVDPRTPMEETMKALHDIVTAGGVRYIGACSMHAVDFAQLQFMAEKNGWTKFISMQSRYNLLYREDERELHRFCNSTGVGMIPSDPFSRNLLPLLPDTQLFINEAKTRTMAPVTEADLKVHQRVHELAQIKEWSPVGVILAWVYRQSPCVLLNFNNQEQIDHALSFVGKELTSSESKFLTEKYKAKELDLGY